MKQSDKREQTLKRSNAMGSKALEDLLKASKNLPTIMEISEGSGSDTEEVPTGEQSSRNTSLFPLIIKSPYTPPDQMDISGESGASDTEELSDCG